MDGAVIEKMDRISALPKTILHDILSRLPEKDAVRTSVLSKAWRETWSTFPILSFCDTQIIGAFSTKAGFLLRRETFLDYVTKSLLRFCDQGLAIKEFSLRVRCFHLQCISRHIDLWTELATESGVQVLELNLPRGLQRNKDGQRLWYTFPQGALEAKSLNELVLNGEISVDHALLNRSIKFFSLRLLSLCHVLLGDEGAIEHLISRCPLIEHITLNWCFVYNTPSIGDLPVSGTSLLKSLSMHGLQKLKGVDVQGIQEVYIDAPNLEYFCYRPDHIHAPFELNFDSCRNLRGLRLLHTVIADKWFLELFSKFPLLESLKLHSCTMPERINISSAKLKVLELSDCSNLKEVNIDAPNLSSFGCAVHGGNKPIISFLSGQLKVNAQIYMDWRRLCKLREYFESFKSQKLSVSLSLNVHQSFVDEPNPDVLQVSSPPPSIKHLAICAVPAIDALYWPIVKRLLSCCCPETISLSLNSRFCSRAFIEFFYETLMGRKQGECHCSSGHTKCWWHGLKNVKVTSSLKIDESVDFKTMLDALPTYAPEENINFRLEL